MKWVELTQKKCTIWLKIGIGELKEVQMYILMLNQEKIASLIEVIYLG